MSYKILILDDDLQVRDSLAMSLEDEGFTVFQVGSSEDALDFLKTDSVDLIIVDVRLPNMNGPDFIQIARKIRPELKYIVYTGSPEYQVPEELTIGANVSNSVFLKPLCEFESLNSEILRMIEGT
ncbi:response regulator [Desulfovibrio inopinatus]|uniref:response regulator n=1 Tax=Desulfovibrio inopinatus TaxID=102109 RepID=UPI0004035873|nr:response regulator [Desulfovibrio inopinatus]